jgi:hypothetical protein
MRDCSTQVEKKKGESEQLADQVAEFLAKGGNVQQMEEVSVGVAWYKSHKPHVKFSREGEMRIIRHPKKRYC